jgi:hypothetical protein
MAWAKFSPTEPWGAEEIAATPAATESAPETTASKASDSWGRSNVQGADRVRLVDQDARLGPEGFVNAGVIRAGRPPHRRQPSDEEEQDHRTRDDDGDKGGQIAAGDRRHCRPTLLRGASPTPGDPGAWVEDL